MRLKIPALLLCLLLLSGCGGLNGGPADKGSVESPAAASDTLETENPEPEADFESRDIPEPEPESEPEPENLFEIIPGSYMFCSGAGGWSTDLTVGKDGGFAGVFHDSDMGDSGEGYPGGTRYYCSFSGKFTQPEQIDETTWFMRIESMELEHPADGTEEYADDVRYIYSGPYGLEHAEELLIYSPDAMADGLPEAFLFWVKAPFDWAPTENGTLGLWGIYNVSEGLGFVMYPRTSP